MTEDHHETNDNLMANTLTDEFELPTTYTEAMKSYQSSKRKDAFEAEIRSKKDLGVYKLVDTPRQRKQLSTRWVFCVKKDKSGNIFGTRRDGLYVVSCRRMEAITI